MRCNRTWIAAGLALALAGGAIAQSPTAVDTNKDTDSAALARMFDEFDRAELAIQPMRKTTRGIRDADYGKWGSQADAAEIARIRLIVDTGAALTRRFAAATLSPKDRLSLRLFQARAKRAQAHLPFVTSVYSFHHWRSWQTEYPAFLISSHAIANEAEAEAYVARIAALGTAADERTAQAKARADAGIIPPKWSFPMALAELDGLLAPGTGPTLAGHPLTDDLRAKLAKLNLPAARSADLMARAASAWRNSAAPAYARFRAEVVRQHALARDDDGVWKLPNGAAYYDMLLESHTTTDLGAEAVHQLGLSETARIQAEMRSIMRKVGFTGSLRQFFDYTRTDPRFFHGSREAYLADARGKLAAIERELPRWFGVLPKDRLEVREVEAFREKNSTVAFYQAPAPDGSRPGIYYVSLYDLKAMSKNEVEAVAFHEGNPGHHLQRSIQFALGEVPAFRRFGGALNTAYSEGWGLYAEQLGKEMGFFTDPYSDFGRLSMEILRSARLVTDTGIHAKRWSRQQAIDWFTANTPIARTEIAKEVERYIVNPGQATAYTVGKLKILELRERARKALGKRFDIRGFHDAVLTSGPVPLDILEENIDAWIAAEQSVAKRGATL